MANYKPPVIASIHGFNTHGHWQKIFNDFISSSNLKTYTFDYGMYMPIFWKWSNEKLVDEFYNKYNKELLQNNAYDIDILKIDKRPSIACHSLGTYIVGYALEKYPDIKFDKVIFCGSILPIDFDWDLIFSRHQVLEVRNETGLKDKPVGFWTRFVPRAGRSGVKGFDTDSKFIEQVEFKNFKHSDYFNGSHMKQYWLPFLSREPIPIDIINGADIDDENTFLKYFEKTGKMDEYYYKKLNYSAVEVSLELALQWIKINKDIYSFLFDRFENDVVGYLNAMPINDSMYDRLLNGDLQDNEIDPNDLYSYEEKDLECNLYIASIVESEEYRKKFVGLVNIGMEKIIRGFIDKLIHYYIKRKIKINKIIATGWTNEGRKLCKLFGMTEVGKDRKFGYPIYTLELNTKSLKHNKEMHKQIKRLIKVYENS